MITQSRLKELLKYNPETGNFTWLVGKRNARIGSIAGYKTFMGYINIQIDKRRFFAHRLAFLYVNGELPPKHVDHISGVKDDNRFDNLRLSDPSINSRNRKMNVRNISGVTGVYWHKVNNSFYANISINCKRVNLGRFDNLFDAVCARKSMESKYGYTSRNSNKQGHLPDQI